MVQFVYMFYLTLSSVKDLVLKKIEQFFQIFSTVSRSCHNGEKIRELSLSNRYCTKFRLDVFRLLSIYRHALL